MRLHLRHEAGKIRDCKAGRLVDVYKGEKGSQNSISKLKILKTGVVMV